MRTSLTVCKIRLKSAALMYITSLVKFEGINIGEPRNCIKFCCRMRLKSEPVIKVLLSPSHPLFPSGNVTNLKHHWTNVCS